MLWIPSPGPGASNESKIGVKRRVSRAHYLTGGKSSHMIFALGLVCTQAAFSRLPSVPMHNMIKDRQAALGHAASLSVHLARVRNGRSERRMVPK